MYICSSDRGRWSNLQVLAANSPQGRAGLYLKTSTLKDLALQLLTNEKKVPPSPAGRAEDEKKLGSDAQGKYLPQYVQAPWGLFPLPIAAGMIFCGLK